MIETVTESTFVDAFVKINRENNFSYYGRLALFEYFEQLEESLDYQIEFDPIAICCEFTEYKNLKELNEAYDKDFKDLEEVREYTEVIEIFALDENLKYNEDGFIIKDW
tara:strand:- start:398 stop:724 length:327 start_codon:yes stop_codon:yes gene_type:complete